MAILIVNGQRILEENYNEVDRITEITEKNEIYLLAFKNGQAGIYQNKKQIIPHVYEEIEYHKQNNLFLVEKNGKQGVKDRQGNEILAVEYDYIMLEEKSLNAQKGEEVYRFDLQGKKQEIESNVTLLSTENSQYSISINTQDKFGIIDKQGNNILANEYTYIEYAFKDYFILTKPGSVALLDAKNRQEVLTGYDVIQKIDNKNVIQVIKNKPYTILLYNEEMQKVASLEEANITTAEDYIKLASKTERMYFDNKGNSIQYQELQPELSLYAFQEKGKWGFQDKEGNVIIAPSYDMVTELNHYGYAGIKKGNKWGVIDEKGTIIVEPSYEIEWEEPEFIGPYCKLNFGYGMVYYTKEITKENISLD